jgi:hypothetical protein
LFEEPKVLVNTRHAGNGTACHCHPTHFSHHVAVFTNDVCLKTAMGCEGSDAVVDFQLRPEMMMPNKRVHLHVEEAQSYLLAVPQPHFIAHEWPAKEYFPVYSTATEVDTKMELFYTLYSADTYKAARKAYTTTPDKWDEQIHPTFGEPYETDELAEWAKHAYGTESLHRMLPPRHPARDAFIPIYSAMNANYEVPVIKGGDISVIEDFINDYHYPYYGQGLGMVICPVCIVDDDDDPCLLDREHFTEHFQALHHKNIDVLGLSFSTRYNVRMMEAFSLYVLCRHYGHQSDFEGYPFLLPTAEDKFGHPSIVDMDKSLVPFFEELHRKKKTGKGLQPLRDAPVSLKTIAEEIKPPHKSVSQGLDDSESRPSRAKTQVKTKTSSKKTRPAEEDQDDEALLDQSSESETEPQDEGQSRQ